MNKTIFVYTLFSLFCGVAHGVEKGDVRVFHQSSYNFLAITSFESNDTATILHLRATLSPGEEFTLPRQAMYLDDEKGRKYSLKGCESIKLQGSNYCNYSGTKDFSLIFEPLKENVRIFDLHAAREEYTSFDFWGIHKGRHLEKGIRPAKGTPLSHKDICMENGTAVIRGKFNPGSSYRRGDTLTISTNDFGSGRYYNKHHCTIQAEGDFEFVIPIECMSWTFIEGKGLQIPVVIYPSDTLFVDISRQGDCAMNIRYKDTQGNDIMPNLMNFRLKYMPWEFNTSIETENYRPDILARITEAEKERADSLCNYLAWKYDFSSKEAHILRMNMYSIISSIAIAHVKKNIKNTYFKQNGSYLKSYVDSIRDDLEIIKSYDFLDFVNCDDYTFFITPYPLLDYLNRIEFIHSLLGKNKHEALERYLKQPMSNDWKRILQ